MQEEHLQTASCSTCWGFASHAIEAARRICQRVLQHPSAFHETEQPCQAYDKVHHLQL